MTAPFLTYEGVVLIVCPLLPVVVVVKKKYTLYNQ
jgi:hypothetical protein